MTLTYIIGGLLLMAIVLLLIYRAGGQAVDPMEPLTKEELLKVNQVVRPSSTPANMKEVDE